MPVGTGAISLQEVVDEIAGAQSSLQDCVDDHNPSGIDPAYGSAPITSLAEFRGYEDTCLTTKTITSFFENGGSGWVSSAAACSGGGSASTGYFAGSGSFPANGDVIYTDSSGCTAYNGANRWYKYLDGSTLYRFQISSSGSVSLKAAC